MGMNIEDVLVNVKDALIKSAKEGKRKGLAEAYTNAIKLVNVYKTEVDEMTNNLIVSLTNMLESVDGKEITDNKTE